MAMTDIMTAQEARDRYGPAFDQAIRDVAALENDSEKMALLLARFGRAGNDVAVAIAEESRPAAGKRTGR